MSTDGLHSLSSPSKIIRKKLTMIDSHHHFFDPPNNTFQAFLKSLNAPAYLPFQYETDVIELIFNKHGIQVEGTVHLVALPDDGIKEVEWVEHLIYKKNECPYIKAIVASCNLSSPNAEAELDCLTNGSIHANVNNYENRVKGIRWILDCVGPFDDGKTATHIATTRFDLDGMDYLRCYSKDSGTSRKTVHDGTCSPKIRFSSTWYSFSYKFVFMDENTFFSKSRTNLLGRIYTKKLYLQLAASYFDIMR